MSYPPAWWPRLTIFILCCGGLIPAMQPLWALSLLPPTFNELVSEAACIVRGRVVQVEPFRQPTSDGSVLIKTRVTWHVTTCLKGAAADTLTLEFLGGRAEGTDLRIPGMPEFAVDNDDYLFVEPDIRVMCPLIAAGHGRYHVLHEATTGRMTVARDDGHPLVDVAQVAQPLGEGSEPTAAIAAGGLSPEQFEARILTVLGK